MTFEDEKNFKKCKNNQSSLHAVFISLEEAK